MRQFFGFDGNFDTGFTQFPYQYSIRAPPKSLPCVRGGGSASADSEGLCFQIRALAHTSIIHYSLASAACTAGQAQKPYRHNFKAPLKNDPSVSFADSSPYAGEPMGCRRNFALISHNFTLRETPRFMPMLRTGQAQLTYGYGLKAPLKKRHRKESIGEAYERH